MKVHVHVALIIEGRKGHFLKLHILIKQHVCVCCAQQMTAVSLALSPTRTPHQ